MGRMNLMQRVSTAISVGLRVLRGTAAEDWNAWFGTASMRGLKTKAGTAINETSAMTISALYAALNFLGGVVASLPLRLRRNLPGGGSESATEHPLYGRLHAKANDSGLTAWQWIYSSLLHKYLWGNWWTWINRANFEMTPLMPDRTWIDARAPRIVHTRDNNGIELPLLDRRDVLLIPHISLGGVTGKGIVHYARESLGLMKAQDEFASGYFGSGIKAGGFVEADTNLNEETRIGLQKDFNEKYNGLGQAWKAIFLTGGAKWKPNELDAQKAQALESRQFSIAEISRWTGLSPHLLHDLSRATFSNIEELDLALVVFTLTPIVTQIEQAMNATFLDDRERAAGYYVKFDLKGLLRGNLQARTAFYTAMLDRGVYNADDVLALEDMNPQPGGLGRAYMLPLNMVNKSMIVGNTVPLNIDPSRMRNVTPSRIGIAAPQRYIAQRSSAQRRRITLAYTPLWESYAKDLLEQEAEAVHAGVRDWLANGLKAEFVTWLSTFYDSFRERIDKLSAPLLSSYAEAILPIAEQEAGSEADLKAQMDSFLSAKGGYRETFVLRHVRHSRGALAGAVTDAEDPEAAAEAVLEEWQEVRPEKLRMHECIRAENAFARNVFILSGITKLRWVAYGKSCPYCQALDGKVIEIQGSFLEPGDFQPDGAEEPLKVTSIRRHPPAHGGCDCSIEASL